MILTASDETVGSYDNNPCLLCGCQIRRSL